MPTQSQSYPFDSDGPRGILQWITSPPVSERRGVILVDYGVQETNYSCAVATNCRAPIPFPPVVFGDPAAGEVHLIGPDPGPVYDWYPPVTPWVNPPWPGPPGEVDFVAISSLDPLPDYVTLRLSVQAETRSFHIGCSPFLGVEDAICGPETQESIVVVVNAGQVTPIVEGPVGTINSSTLLLPPESTYVDAVTPMDADEHIWRYDQLYGITVILTGVFGTISGLVDLAVTPLWLSERPTDLGVIVGSVGGRGVRLRDRTVGRVIVQP